MKQAIEMVNVMQADTTHGEIRAQELSRLSRIFDSSLCPMEYGLGNDMNSLAVTRFNHVNLQGIDVIRDEGTGCRIGVRKEEHIASNPRDEYLLPFASSAEVSLRQAGKGCSFSSGSFSLLSTSFPFSAEITSPDVGKAFSHRIVRISGPLLRQRIPNIDRICGMRIAARPGIGRIMQALLEAALEDSCHLSLRQSKAFSEGLIDTIAETILSAPELAQELKSKTKQERIRERAECFILANLDNPDLDSSLIAHACHISVRSLRAAFSTSPYTLGTYIRESRLKQCHRSLLDPALINQSILEIALSWGFNDAAYFSRAYKQSYGQTPSKSRALILHQDNKEAELI